MVEQAPSEEESESESEDESAPAKPTVPKAKPAPVVEGEESDDSIDWIASESESDSSDDELGPPGTVLHHTMFLKYVHAVCVCVCVCVCTHMCGAYVCVCVYHIMFLMYVHMCYVYLANVTMVIAI